MLRYLFLPKRQILSVVDNLSLHYIDFYRFLQSSLFEMFNDYLSFSLKNLVITARNILVVEDSADLDALAFFNIAS